MGRAYLFNVPLYASDLRSALLIRVEQKRHSMSFGSLSSTSRLRWASQHSSQALSLVVWETEHSVGDWRSLLTVLQQMVQKAMVIVSFGWIGVEV